MQEKKHLIKPNKDLTIIKKVTLYVINENCQCCTINMTKC